MATVEDKPQKATYSSFTRDADRESLKSRNIEQLPRKDIKDVTDKAGTNLNMSGTPDAGTGNPTSRQSSYRAADKLAINVSLT
jgi:hypothetical protein